eukprot:1158530-Pelagomonas_calceolata.AAC.8
MVGCCAGYCHERTQQTVALISQVLLLGNPIWTTLRPRPWLRSGREVSATMRTQMRTLATTKSFFIGINRRLGRHLL